MGTAATFSPPAHSIAVLPFVNMSGDPKQEYFSEGLTEELLNSLSRIDDLQVAARTSSFSFGEHADVATITRKLNVAYVLEGSVRRSGNAVRVTTQLIDGITGFHVRSDTYDRDLRDMLKLQTEIATAVAAALKMTLLPEQRIRTSVGGTRNAAALDAYLRASRIYWGETGNWVQSAIDGYTEAVRLDPNYALAFSARAIALQVKPGNHLAEMLNDAHRAISLAPQLGEAHLALANTCELLLDFKVATQEYDQAMALDSGNERVLRHYGLFAVMMGHSEPGLAATRRAVTLDPLNYNDHGSLGVAQLYVRHYRDAAAAIEQAMRLAPSSWASLAAFRGRVYYVLGDYKAARLSCELQRDSWPGEHCLALVYNKLGRRADAEAELKKLETAAGDDGSYEYATIYAQWGNRGEALDWLEKAMRLRDSELEQLKTDPLIDPLRNERRFHAVEQALTFPE